MKLVVIEAPYWAAPDKLGKYLAECIRDSLKRGESPIASVATFALSNALNESTPAERELGMRAGWAWYRKADLCAAYIDHGTSSGVMRGIEQARLHDVPIELRFLYADPPRK